MTQHQTEVLDIADGKLDAAAALDFVSDSGFGGITMFVGRVRDLNHGRDVTGISYDMFVPLALNGFAAIAARAEADFGGKLVDAFLADHRRIHVGDQQALPAPLGLLHNHVHP